MLPNTLHWINPHSLQFQLNNNLQVNINQQLNKVPSLAHSLQIAEKIQLPAPNQLTFLHRSLTSTYLTLIIRKDAFLITPITSNKSHQQPDPKKT